MILACKSIQKSFGGNAVLRGVSFHINEHQKAALIGINGAGKSTLLKIITGEENADSGEVVFAKNATLGYLAQHQDLNSERSIYEEVREVKADIFALQDEIRRMEHRIAELGTEKTPELDAALTAYADLTHTFEAENGYAAESEITGVLKGLGFSDDEFSKPIRNLSGGQKTRVFLGKLLLSQPDLIMLDEPTNHLDMNSIAWLETYLNNYSGAVIIVSHDRYFLDRVVTKVIEIENGTAREYEGNYTAFAEKKEMLRNAAMKAWTNQQQEIRHQEAVITKLKSFNREKSIKRAESREKMLDKIERVDRPVEVDDKISLELSPAVTSGNDVLTVRGLTKGFDGVTLFSGVDFDIKRGERVALIGNNGTGKTTMLKIINELEQADAGEISLGSNVKIGYYDQEHQVLTMSNTLFEELQSAYPNLNNTRVRSVLAAFLFTEDDVFKKIEDLSGGERGRVSLAKLMLSAANLLVLDEPTNHLDITSKEILESALNRYTGTVFYVSHDRYFINRTATRILDLTHEHVINYLGNYDYYLEKREETESRVLYGRVPVNPEVSFTPAGAAAAAPGGASSPKSIADEMKKTAVKSGEQAAVTNAKSAWQKQKEEQARYRRRENDIKKLTDEIDALEARNTVLDEELTDPAVYSSYSKAAERTEEKKKNEERIEELMEEWEQMESEEE